MLRGDKVHLRPVKRSDLESFLEWFNDAEVLQYLSLYLPMTEMGEEKFIEEVGTASPRIGAMFVIENIEAEQRKPIGITGLSQVNNKDQNAVFGIAIGEKDYWSSGYGTEAAKLVVRYGFEQMNLHRITSSVVSFNERSYRLHRKVGFTEEGRRRDHMFKNGSYADQVMFGLLRKEWKEISTC